MLLMGRRALIGGAIAAGCSLAWPPRSRAAQDQALSFSARRDGKPIGTHRVHFTRDADRLIVDIKIRILASLASIPNYRYRHKSREVWADGRLLALGSVTYDDGAWYRVVARAQGQRLMVEGADGRLELPADTLPTSYWREDTVTRAAWLQTQSGRLVYSEVDRLPVEPILAAGRTVEARHFRLTGDIDCELWYHAGRWSKLRFVAPDGSTVGYVLEPDEPVAL